MEFPLHSCTMLVPDIRHGAKPLHYGTKEMTFQIHILPDLSSLLQCYTDTIF